MSLSLPNLDALAQTPRESAETSVVCMLVPLVVLASRGASPCAQCSGPCTMTNCFFAREQVADLVDESVASRIAFSCEAASNSSAAAGAKAQRSGLAPSPALCFPRVYTFAQLPSSRKRRRTNLQGSPCQLGVATADRVSARAGVDC